MALKKETIQKLQIILREEYGRGDLSFKQVSDIARGLIGFYDTLGKIYHKSKRKNHEVTQK